MEVKAYVLDTSALLAWLQGEPGGDDVSDYLSCECYLSAVNLAELVCKLVDSNYPDADRIPLQLRSIGVNIAPFDDAQALTSSLLRAITRPRGLSLGDRACLALAQHLKAEVITADSAWMNLDIAITITNIRR